MIYLHDRVRILAGCMVNKTGKVLKAERVDWFVVKIDGESLEWFYESNELSKVNQDEHAD
jgi:hypothetical protein